MSTTEVDPPSADTSGDDAGGTSPVDEPQCGDAVAEGEEECDLGPDNGNGGFCRDDCRVNICGDDYLGPGELCDDGNLDNDDDCSDQCGPTTCGDGVLQPLEECDDGPNNSDVGACLENCATASCGDQNIWEGMEICDADDIGRESCQSQGFDGGTLVCTVDCAGFDTSSCYACGNGAIEANEDCDGDDFGGLSCMDFAPAGTTASGSLTCPNCLVDSSACTFCGDNVVEGNEVCDGSNFGGASCGSLLGNADLGGPLTCAGDCSQIDTSECCVMSGGVCNAGMGPGCCEGMCFADMMGQGTCPAMPAPSSPLELTAVR